MPERICECIDEILFAMAAAEALEHNYRVNAIKQEEEKEPRYIREPIAVIGIVTVLREIKEKSKIETTELIYKKVKKAFAHADKDQFSAAAEMMVRVKEGIFDLARELCGKEPSYKGGHIGG